ncbi:ketoacyl-ACP synthase III [uncultured Rikenella sp.]|uniref:ketoacyl-ACP synthase III n=1 Tax=uncultured Rikenella sp. TaxID=368003 RepID=UPI00260A080F|nr:ketoacyl-ACP synthase III [uncultured Rikenella sp.]
MAQIKFQNIGIRAVAACVPQNISYNKDLGYLIPEDEIDKTINSIGIKEKRFADQDVCSSDLCFKAAEKLFADNNLKKEEVGALIFVSQTPDYHQPATSASLQHRLGLSQQTLCFDVNLACSGYVYGLSIAFAFAQTTGVDNVLLLVGETMSKTISPKDKVTFPLFGDAGTATWVSKIEGIGDAFFSLNSDGADAHILNMPYGGYRNPSCVEGLAEITNADGNTLSGEHLHMDGMEVFNFGLRVVPKSIKETLSFAGLRIDEIDLILFHQANRFMTDFFAKKLKFPTDKIPYSLDLFGNTSSASIPLTICHAMYAAKPFDQRGKIVLCGFGAGLSWATAILNLDQCRVSELIEY